MSNVVIPEALSHLLRANLLEERDLLESISLTEIAEPDDSGRSVCRCMVPVRRQFDPETAELRRLEVTLVRQDSTTWEVESIGGLRAQTPDIAPLDG